MGTEFKARLFPIQAYDYQTGLCADGRQVVMGLLYPYLVAFFFDGEGNLVDREEQPASAAAANIAGREPPYQINSNEFHALIDEQLRSWQAELRFRPTTIRVKQFLDTKYPAGIQIFPGDEEDIDPVTWFSDEQERREFVELRDHWLAAGKFVWWWGRDYYMSKDGEVEST